MAFASGKYALAICDRCGFEYPYSSIKKEWTGSRVCSSCYEPKHPQLEPKRNISDPQGLRNSRPARREPQLVPVGLADSPFVNYGAANTTFDLRPYPLNRPVKGVTRLGTVVASGDANVSVSGFGLSASLGNESTPGVTTYVYPTGFEITSALGSVSLSTDQVLSVNGVSATSSLGTDTVVFPLFFGEGVYSGAAWDGYE